MGDVAPGPDPRLQAELERWAAMWQSTELMSKLLGVEAGRDALGERYRLQFENVSSPTTPFVQRYLTLEGRRAFEIGNSCDTCAFYFTRLEGANGTVSLNVLRQQLAVGISSFDGGVIDEFSKVIPAGRHDRLLLETSLEEIVPGGAGDYFAHEQVALWGIDAFWGLPHYPATPYYRCGDHDLGGGSRLYEFIVPMTPPTWRERKTVAEWVAVMQGGARPTAVTISVLDVKQPANWSGDPAVTKHACLTHFLVDGHHKVQAASESGCELTLLSFLSHAGVHTDDERGAVVDALAR